MEMLNFNLDWSLKTQDNQQISVTLPHDAMISQPREASSKGGSGHGFFEGGIYEYTKSFTAPISWQDKTISIHFEGVYKNATVYLNGEKLYYRPNGYVPFTVCLDSGLKYAEQNTIKVVADNSKLPNSRWYTGSGIYRPVSLLIAEKTHIAFEGVKITTLSYLPPKIKVETTANGGQITAQILDGEKMLAVGNGNKIVFDLPNATLWSEHSPKLYTCKITLRENEKIVDSALESFGIRIVNWSVKGLFINGNETLLRGGCVHHDNGILGACAYDTAEERKVRIMKEAGFNAIRSAHNLCSKAMLKACDKYGVYMMDESADMWYMAKTKYDYHLDFEEWWQEDIAAMVNRDYNHPSVIFYSIGNEVSEPCEQKGVEIGAQQVDFIHQIDKTRAVTCGTNLMIISRAAKGKGIYQDGETKAEKQKNAAKKDKSTNASLMFNIIASFVGTSMNKAGNSDKVDKLTSPFLDKLDIVGYNYASGRYPLEAKKHPNRVIFGSETFPQDIAKNWDMVRKYPYLVGDFMWAGWDYLGESGIGAWSYQGGLPFARPYPWVLAGAGVIDILGNPDASCRYAATVWGQINCPVIAVKPVNHPGVRPSKSVWRGTNALESWAWQGCENNKAEIEVFANAHSVELLVNNKSLGKRQIKAYKARFKTKYEVGTLKAIAYNENGDEIGTSLLNSAKGEVQICATPEKTAVLAGNLAYIDVSLKGENGVVEANADCDLTVCVEGGELLAFGSANPCTPQTYHSGVFSTYYGRAQAVVRRQTKGEIHVKVYGKSLKTATATIIVE